VVAVEQAHHFVVSLASGVILEDPNCGAGWIVLTQVVGQLDFLMNGVVAVNESADESDYDDSGIAHGTEPGDENQDTERPPDDTSIHKITF
jgi:hypothetical protein